MWDEYLLVFDGRVFLEEARHPQSLHRTDWEHIARDYRVIVDRDDLKVFVEPGYTRFHMWAWVPSQ